MEYSLLAPIIRHGLQMLGGILVGIGWLDQSAIDPFIGLGINLGALVWWGVERALKSDD